MSIRATKLERDPEWTADVAVIGSGAAGAVWASLLADRGVDVIVLEEGGHYTKEHFTQREGEMYKLLYRDAVNQFTVDQRVNVQQGRCVGGSTVVNMADCERIPPEILAHWRGLTGIDEFDARVFEPLFAEAEAAIHVNRVAPEQLNRNNLILKEATEKAGQRGAAFMHNRVNCAGSGYCLIGCAYDAKQSTLVTLIPAAEHKGARIVAEARAERFEHENGVIKAVTGSRLDPATGAVAGRFSVRAKTFVLAAGAVHSPLLLMRSGLGGPEVGRNLSLQPQLPVMALFKDAVTAHRGIPQAYYNDQFEVHSAEKGLGGFRLEGIAGGPAMSASSGAFIGHAHKELMTKYAHIAALLLLVPDRPLGRVVLDADDRPQIRYELQPEWKKQARKGMKLAGELYLSAGAEVVMLPVTPPVVLRGAADFAQIKNVGFDIGAVSTISAHPQGTCRIGVDPRKSVAGPDGRVHGTQNLIVSDASLFPTTAATHTMIPVMAVARWLAAKYINSRA